MKRAHDVCSLASHLAGLAALTIASITACFAQAPADNWPSRTIRLIAPIEAGGGTDLSLRLVAQKMTQTLGTTVVENRPGAAGLLGMQAVMNSPADGYTFVGVNDDRALVLPYLYRTPPYDPLKDFVYVGHMFITGSMIIVVGANSPVNTFQQFVQMAKAKPGLTYSTYGVGSTPHLGFEALMRRLGMTLTHIPYKGSAPALASVVKGETFTTAGSQALPFVQQGTLRALAVGGSTRFARLPDVPALAELGAGSDIFQAPFTGLGAKAGTPRPVIDKLSGELKRILAMPDLIAGFEKLNLITYWSTPEEFTEMVRASSKVYVPLIKELGLANQ